ncbi:MAG: S9 family peptidase [Betaproteobacteria bacterium]|nr:S9 family peptidase [Betaproteobacteria bacterium]
MSLAQSNPSTAAPGLAKLDIVPPAAKRVPKEMVNHGDKRVDDYFWLREKDNPDTIAYLKAENAYTDAVMAPLKDFREALYKEMLARIKETDQNVPWKKGGYWYYSRTEQGKQYNIYCRKKGTMEAQEEIVLDLNKLAEGKPFLSLGLYEISPDGKWLAYSLDYTGFREYSLYFKNMETGEVLADKIDKIQSAAWANDNKTIFYVIEDKAKRPHKLLRHQLGGKNDELLFEEKDELYRLGVETTRSQGYVVATSASSETSEVRVLDASKPAGAFKVVVPRKFGHMYSVDHHGDRFYIVTNDKGRNFRLVTAPAVNPAQKTWKQMIPHRKDVLLSGIDMFEEFFVAIEQKDALPQLRMLDINGRGYAMKFPEAVYTASAGMNAEYKTDTYRFNYQSFTTPSSVFDYNVKTKERKLMKQQPVLGDFDPTRYESKRLWAKAKDGKKIPVSVVYRKDKRATGPQATHLQGYGSYGYSYPVTFSSSRLSLLDRGVVFAVAHIRGGSDLGKQWHDDGKMMKKKNTFTDFINSAEFLIAEKYTTPGQLTIQGGSAGGLLMGAVVNMRPDLFKAVVSQVPFVDVMNTMLDASLPLTVGEYLEWGNPNEKKAYQYMRSYSPYDNLEKKAYPAMLIETSLNDSQVMYWEPAKYVAKLRTLKPDQNPLLLKTNMDAGHGGASGRYDYLKEVAFTYSFILAQHGLAK